MEELIKRRRKHTKAGMYLNTMARLTKKIEKDPDNKSLQGAARSIAQMARASEVLGDIELFEIRVLEMQEQFDKMQRHVDLDRSPLDAIDGDRKSAKRRKSLS